MLSVSDQQSQSGIRSITSGGANGLAAFAQAVSRPPETSLRLKLVVRGAVQGVGFRPFVHRLAKELGLTGWVNNSPQGVFIEAEGRRKSLEAFLLRLAADKPPLASIQSLEPSWLDATGFQGFEIRPSAVGGAKTTLVLPDIATCPDCLREILDPANRRHQYPFTNCTNCGPRFSIIEALPYDRANTAMKSFGMCPQCQAEYDDARDRRFHAQPNACPVCGPRLELWNSAGEAIFGGHQALRAAAHAIRQGRIVAVKGIGGFHLMADARNELAVQRLRTRKHREEKPFAVMFPSLESVRNLCELSPLEARLLGSPEAPIVLLRQRKATNAAARLASGIAPGNPNLGVLLPSNPLQHLLMRGLNFPVVATSGNVSDEPISTDEYSALQQLGKVADLFLVHNRPIVRQVDDSVLRVMLDRELVLRRARGYAPLPISLNRQSAHSDAFGARACDPQHDASRARPQDTFGLALRAECCGSQSRGPGDIPPILAVGAHLKNSIALAVDGEVFLSQHIGDLATEPANLAFRRVIGDFEKLYEARIETVAADLHPDYLSTQFADKLNHVRHVGVQHHVAHVLSCLTENEVAPPALGIAWDGTGLGLDGTIWGGEFFQVTANDCERVAQLRPFPLPGGDKAVQEPRRAALGLLWEMSGDAIFKRADLRPVRTFSKTELAALKTMLHQKINSPPTSSVGRLFDAVGSLTGRRQATRFEGQTAMELEFDLEGGEPEEAYHFPLVYRRSTLMLDWAPMTRQILEDVAGGISTGLISAKFHNALAEGIVAVANCFGLERVAISGGCFQNRYLTERVIHRLRAAGFQPYWHQRVPPNDGGIALGQIAAALRSQPSVTIGRP